MNSITRAPRWKTQVR